MSDGVAAGAGAASEATVGDDPTGWVLLPRSSVPERWRSRGRDVVLVPLLAEEMASVLDGTPASPVLDDRDERLAEMVSAGASIPQMARAVGLSPRGVQHRLARLRERFGVATTAELIAELVQLGLATVSRGNTTPKDCEAASTNPPSSGAGPAQVL